jgi:TatD DNase family protein
MLFDTHAHVNFKSFKDDANETLQRALDAGVNVINVGSQIDTSRQAVELANSFEKGVYAVVGLHPEHTHSQYVDEEETHFLSREENFNYEEYKKLAQNGKVVGIGECGLDYYRLPEDKSLHKKVKEKQKAAFRLQLKLAKELNKALVIHSRPEKGNEELFDDLVNILDEEKIGDLRFEVHSFTGSPEALKKFLDRGSYVSFNGIITFDKTGNMEKLVKMAPMDKIILETDCPYLTPVPHRGKRNEPAYVRFVAEHVARVKGLSVAEVAEATSENTKNLFHLPV